MSHMFFKHSEANIIILFENKGLLNRDKKQNELFEIFKEADKSAYAKRLKYKVQLKKITGAAKTIIIADECDAVMFKNLLSFNQVTKEENIFVIGLTATAYDGVENGGEAEAIKRLGYKVYRTCKDDKAVDPIINETVNLSTTKKFVEKIREQMFLRPVLVLARKERCGELAKNQWLENIQLVTEETPYDDLRMLGEKKGLAYPVYMANEDFGWRGVDYRCANPGPGITLIVGAAFGDQRERVQALLRVGR